jgi:hypothetical protein
VTNMIPCPAAWRCRRRDRLAGIIRMVPYPAVLRAAEDLCAEAIAAVGAYTAMHQAPQRQVLQYEAEAP